MLGCKSGAQFAVVDPHVDLVDAYLEIAERQGSPIVAVFDTHLQADHVSGLPPRWSPAPARPRTSRRGPAWSSRITRSLTARS